MSFSTGLVIGIVIAAATVALEHYGPSVDPLHLSLAGNGALAAPEIGVPLAIFWGWAWAANRWAGRSLLPTVAYTLGLFLGVGLIAPADALAFPQSGAAGTLSVNDLFSALFQGSLFVGTIAVIAAPIYWVLKSRVGGAGLLIWLLYLVGIVVAAVVPLFGAFVTGGIVAGTGAAHAWHRQGRRLLVGIVVIVVMALAVFGVPYVLANGLAIPR